MTRIVRGSWSATEGLPRRRHANNIAPMRKRLIKNFPCRRCQRTDHRALIICLPKHLAPFSLFNVDRHTRVAPRISHVSIGLSVEVRGPETAAMAGRPPAGRPPLSPPV